MSQENTIDRRYLLRRYNESKILITSDIHLGFEAEWFNKGLKTSEPDWSYKIIDQLKDDIQKTSVNNLLILGDLEHSFFHFKSSKRTEDEIWVPNKWLKEKALKYFIKQIVEIEGLKITLIRGNQDTSFVDSLKEKVEIIPLKGTSLFDQLGLFHGHKKPCKTVLFSSEILLGHVHPAIEIIDELNIRHKFPVFAKLNVSREELFQIFDFHLELGEVGLIEEIPITILPPYNMFMGGFILNQNRKKKTFPVLWNLIRHPKLRIQLTNGIDLGIMQDLTI